MQKRFQTSLLKRILVTGGAFLACVLSAHNVPAAPSDDINNFWYEVYVNQNENIVEVTDELFQWTGVKEEEPFVHLAHGQIAPGSVVVSSLPNGGGDVYSEGPEYDMGYFNGTIYIDKDEPRMLTGTPYYISYKYVTEPSETVLAIPGSDEEQTQVIGKAPKDQCFNGDRSSSERNNIAAMLGEDEICPAFSDNADADAEEDDATIYKANQGYVWSMFVAGDKLWFGTVPNTYCLVYGGVFGENYSIGRTNSRGEDRDERIFKYVCEYGASPYANAQEPPLDSPAGDWRPPHIYYYDTAGGGDPVDVTPDDPLINDTMGIRATGAANGVVITGGPTLDAIGGGSLSAGTEGAVNLFAFDASTGEFLGSRQLTDYNDIRKWVLIDGVLYTSMKYTGDDSGDGHILRWNGNRDNPLGDDAFEVVGIIPNGMGAYLAKHEGRIFTTTWPAFESSQGGTPGTDNMASLWMSPVIPAGGLTNAHADYNENNENDPNKWTRVWNVGEYEKDYITKFTYGGGALASFNGYLYWGTISVPGVAYEAALSLHCAPGCPETPTCPLASINLDTDGDCSVSGTESLATFQGTHRPLALFRGRNFVSQADKEVELLYGLEYMPVYYNADIQFILHNKASASYTIEENDYHRNAKGEAPSWGAAGFNNAANVYTWAMEVYNNRLYIGTFDQSYVASFGDMGAPVYGGDLYRIDCDNSIAKIENLTGVGNYTNYGIRNMATDNESLYLGMANPMNLLPEGGWELLKLEENGEAGICGNTCSPQAGINLSFSQEATGGGCSAAASSNTGLEPPTGFVFVGDTYYDIDISGDFSGTAEVCFTYDEADVTGDEADIALYHRADALADWQDITTSVNTVTNTVCGTVTSFSDFALFEPEPVVPSGGGGGGGGCFISTAVNSFLGL